VTKLNNYEANYQARVTKIRDSELSLLRKELAVWALTLVVTVSSPLIATAGTFILYVLLDDENILTASRTFSVLLLFAALRFPINYAGRLAGSKFHPFCSYLDFGRSTL
jgi:ATP-binding cassette subfamily C (CFTR/MRP) protein 1